MDEVGGALIAISLVLIAVFLPTAFITGLQGAFYKQFAITIAASTAISALRVAHALARARRAAAEAARGAAERQQGARHGSPRRSAGSSPVQLGFEALSACYGAADGAARPRRRGVPDRLRRLVVPRLRPAGQTPTGLIPQLDRAYFIAAFQLPPGATLEPHRQGGAPGADDHSATRRASSTPWRSSASTAPPSPTRPTPASSSSRLKPFEERGNKAYKDKILADRAPEMCQLREAFVFVLEPPSVPGIGTGGGLKGYVAGSRRRAACRRSRAPTWALAGAAGQTPWLHPGLHAIQHPHAADLRRDRPYQGGAAGRADRARVRHAVGLHGLGLRQRLQYSRPHLSGHGAGRRSFPPDLRDVANLKTRNDSGDMVPIGSVADVLRHDRALPRAALQSLSGGRGPVGAGRAASLGPGHRRDREARRQEAALGFRLRMDRNRVAGKARRQYRDRWPSASPSFSSSCCSPRSTRAGCCRSPSS